MIGTHASRYWRLEAPEPTPPDEICSCTQPQDLKLQYSLGFNPIHCMVCNLEVRPSVLQFSGVLAEALQKWNTLRGALETLWLDSGEYEAWASSQLVNPGGWVNTLGRQLAKDLRAFRPTYYNLFMGSQSPRDFHCPICEVKMARYADGDLEQLVCLGCWLVMFPDEVCLPPPGGLR